MYQHSPKQHIQNSKQLSENNSRLFNEIATFMRAYGDCEAQFQCRESIILVEKILIEQLRHIIQRAGNCKQADFELLMLRNKPKLLRFQKYMRNVRRLQMKSEQKASGSGLGLNVINRLTDGDDEEEELSTIFDEEYNRRLWRADRISQILTPQKYEEFTKARSWCSNPKNKSEFLRKLADIIPVPKEMNQDFIFLEIIQFLTQETIATICDFSILTRLNSKNLIVDPVIVSSNISNDMLHLCSEVTQGRANDGIQPIKVYEIQEAMRRVQIMHQQRRLGNYRSFESKIPLLAL
jgi:hypothetical protein